MSWPDWGNVPSWASTGALILALATFVRTNHEKKREQVDSFSIWTTLKISVLEDGPEKGKYLEPEVIIKNDSKKHLRITQVGYSANCLWQIPDPSGIAYEALTDTRLRVQEGRRFSWVQDLKSLKPEEERTVPLGGLMLETPPQEDARIHYEAQIKIEFVHLVDHIGRRWQVVPDGKALPKRAYWFRFYRAQWKIPRPDHPWHTRMSKTFAHALMNRRAKDPNSSSPLGVRYHLPNSGGASIFVITERTPPASND
ncbi:hypothetical protein ACFQ05_18735 [Amycolatopsis umgeniensis]|uniref:Uncharacterized protein n=1 Tax=Amycolatopsis umgeniensis TaxID=336628 RepID=A0A841BGK7_9PSEU|nr:hypothetical protein [Amycolatopsis umgeniensis]